MYRLRGFARSRWRGCAQRMKTDSPLKSAFLTITTPEVLAQVIAIVVAGVVAILGAHVVKSWQNARDPVASRDWTTRAVEGAVIVTPFMVALIVLLIVRASMGAFGMHTVAVDTALQLTTALVLVRF